jgi:hypothetical protein
MLKGAVMTQIYPEDDLQAKMMAGVMAWRRIAEAMRGMRGVLAPSLVHDLEVMAEGFDTLPMVWSLVEDLKRDLERAERGDQEPEPTKPALARIETAKLRLGVHVDKFFEEVEKALGGKLPPEDLRP